MHQKQVLELIADRAFAKNNNITINDGARLCLAVEGGAMRGIISAGMLLALHDLQLLDLFDDFVGISAGSLNLAYILAGQGALGLSLYFEDMTNKDIVDLLRFRSKTHPIMDMRKLYDHTTTTKRIDVEVLERDYRESFRVAVTNVTKNKGELINLSDSGLRFHEFLMSGALLPFVAGDPWVIRSNEYFDGGLYYIDPSQTAEELGCTHCFSLQTRTQDKPLKPWAKPLEKRIQKLDENYPGAGSHYLERLKAYFETYSTMPYGETAHDSMRLYRHALPNSIGIGRMTRDKEKIINGMTSGYQSIIDIFYREGHVGIMPVLI